MFPGSHARFGSVPALAGACREQCLREQDERGCDGENGLNRAVVHEFLHADVYWNCGRRVRGYEFTVHHYLLAVRPHPVPVAAEASYLSPKGSIMSALPCFRE